MTNQRIGFGTAAIGRPQYINIRDKKAAPFDLEKFKANAFAVLESAYQQGIRYYDTASGYGLAEQLLIDWVKEKNDPTIEVATKWGYVYVANFDPAASVHEVKDHSVAQLEKQWKESIKLLPNLTTLQIHSATFDTGVMENKAVIAKLAQLKADFGIKIGITTTGENQVEVLRKALTIKADNAPLFEVFQITYNILDQSLLKVIELINNNNNRIIIKEALANGRIFPNPNYAHYHSLYSTLTEIAQKYTVGIDAIALQFCIQTVNPFKVLSGASDTEQLAENLKVNTFQLSNEEINLLKTCHVNPTQYWKERKLLTWN